MADNLYDFDNNGLARAYKDCKWALFDRSGNQIGEWYSYIEVGVASLWIILRFSNRIAE